VAQASLLDACEHAACILAACGHGQEKLRNNSARAGFARRKLLDNRQPHMTFADYFAATDARASAIFMLSGFSGARTSRFGAIMAYGMPDFTSMSSTPLPDYHLQNSTVNVRIFIPGSNPCGRGLTDSLCLKV
jgi:hypothetical protein